jgi:uncharacterized membrane protein YphA (DoxX/SURF4 family)
MAIDRQGTGLTVARVCIGLFFLAEGVSKYRWFSDPSILAGQLATWASSAPSGSLHGRFVEGVALPWAAYFARLVPLGEITCGVALIIGFWTSIFALIAFLMALTFQFASGALFRVAFLTSGYGLPVLGSTLGLAIGGVRLPWSVRS